MGIFDTYIHDVNIDFIYSSPKRKLNSRGADLGNVVTTESNLGIVRVWICNLFFE